MLPSTGYFKAINCPFYDNGLCERPYCHYRHVRKDSQNTGNDGIESGAILQKLVSAAVQKVLQQTETSSTKSIPQAAEDSVEQCVEDVSKVNNVQSVSKATYNPTPISQLNKINNIESVDDETTDQRKRHIPVPYTPRKPANAPIKRHIETNGSSKPFVFTPPVKYTLGCSDTVLLDPYMPKGSQESSETYLPGSETELQQYRPNDTQTSGKRNYVPSEKKSTRKKLLEYKPVKVSIKSETSSVTYQPTLRSLAPCFSSDEEEPDTKISRISNDLNSFDDLGPEFDILDQILDDERHEHNTHDTDNKNIISEKTKYEPTEVKDRVIIKQNREKKNDGIKEKHTSGKKESIKSQSKAKSDKPDFDIVKEILDKEKPVHDTDNTKTEKTKQALPKEKERESSKENRKKIDDHSKKEKHTCDKKENKKSQDKTKLDKKDKSISDNKEKHEIKSTSSNKKSHKHSSKDKVREEKQVKSVDKKKHYNSKSSDRSSRSSDGKSSRNAEKHSKHSSSSKSDSTKRKYKSHNSSEQSKDKQRKHKEEKSLCNDLSDNDSIHNADDEVLQENDEESCDMSDPDEEMIALECKRIFEEYVPQKKTTNNVEENDNALLDDTSEIEYIPGKKRVSRTKGKDIKVMPKEKIKPNFKVNAAQMMAERLTKIREYHASKTVFDTIHSDSSTSKSDISKNFSNTPNTGNKIRIAHVPYASTLISAKKTFTPNPVITKDEPSTSSTVIQTIKKGVQRVAHMPNEKFIDRPGVLEPLGSKIAANIRSTYLNMMIDECLKIYLSATDAYARSQYEELATSKKCSTVQIYKNSAVLTVSRLRKEFQECNGVKKSGYDCAALKKIPQTISGKTANAGSWSIESKYRGLSDNSKEFTGAKFYSNIKKWVLTEEQLQDNGFPRPHASGESGKATIHIQNKNKPPKGFLRTCCRCKKDYTVDKKGFPAVNKECIYHPNNKYRVRGEAKYQCCSQDATSDGCCIAPCHVYDYVDYEHLRGYVRTLPPEAEMEDYGVYSLDCEMCYTTHGLDLTRVTVINTACKVVYETFIKPLRPIIDYNTRYSGITEEHMSQVTTTLLDVQATLLTMFNSRTILIGHSLESDFKALKLIHDTVIDTSVLYPHKMGPPYKRALRNLSSEYLKKIIQNSVDGHDSAEDATVCMELIMYKLREDLKTR